MGLWILLSLQLAATALGFAYLWRRQRRLDGEVVRLREEVAALSARAAARKRPRLAKQAGGAALADTSAEIVEIAPRTPQARAARAWRLSEQALPFEAGAVSPDTVRGLVLGAAAAAPALGFLFGLDAPALIAAGIGIAAAMMLLGLHGAWRAASWAGVITAIGWALIGLTIGAAQNAPVSYCVFVAFAGLSGLAQASLRHLAPGAAMSLAMAFTALVLASLTTMVGPAGVAFGVLVAAAAIVGALSLRLEEIHFAAFGAALIGLFVLSGQDAAAIWFTPVTAWAGALFLGVAAVRVPQLGPRGFALASVGALAPLLAIGALHMAQHGLADRFAAAGALIGLALMLAGVTALAALRRPGGLSALKLTLWALTAGAFIAISDAVLLAAPAPFAAPAFASLALGLTLLNARLPHAAWRAFACASAAFAAGLALVSAHMLLNEAPGWPPWALIAAGLAAPSALVIAAAAFARRADFTVGMLESVAFALAVIAANLGVRLLFSDGAMLLQPVGFIEAGAHVSVWLLASLLLAWRARYGSRPARIGAAVILAIMALLVSAFAGGLWLSPYWSEREAVAAPITHAPLGFLAPALLFWAHWLFWRARGAEVRTRAALAAAAMLTAAYVTLELMRSPDAPAWAAALGGAAAFAAAIGVNFAPAIARGRRRSHREEEFHRDWRRQQRG